MSLIGDDVLEDIENAESSMNSPSKPPPPSVQRSLDFGDEAPPIPAHTMASMELIEHDESASVGGAVGSGSKGGRAEGSRTPKIQEPLSSTYDVVGVATDSVYEQPPPPKRKLCVCTFVP